MEKTMKLGDIVNLGGFLLNTEDVLDGMKMNAKSIYNIFKLKKMVIEQFSTAQETIMTLAKSFGATPMEDGQQGLQVPADRLDEFNKDYAELMKEEIKVSYEPIEISATAECSSKFMETFFEFITITD